MAFLTLLVYTTLLYASCYGQEDFQILTVAPHENEVFLEWSLNLTAPETNPGFNLTLTYDGPCPNVSYISVETVPNTARNHTFTGLEEFSSYTVVIGPLSEGLESLQETRSLQTLPSAPELPPQNLRLARAMPTLLTVEWDPVPCLQQNSLITAYFVVVENDTYSSSSNVSASGDLMFTATGLEPNSIYTVRVYPVTSQFGQSQLFASLNLTTLMGVQITRAVPLSNGRVIFVEWTYPREAEDSVRSYSIFAGYQGPCSGVSSRGFFVRDGSARNHFLGTAFVILRPGTDYEISITAFATEGTTESSSVQVRTLPQVLPPPNNLALSAATITTISLQWDPIPCLERNVFDPPDYYVGLLRENQPESEEQVFLSNSDSEFVLTDLEPDTGYVARVHTLPRGGSFRGDHGTSLPLRVRTQPDLLISADLISENGFRVNWIYPSDLTGLEGFDVRLDYLGACEALAARPLPVIARQPSEARSFIFSQLEERFLYNVTVTAVNPQEFRTASMTVITNSESQAIAPLNISVTDVTTSSITVEFIPSVACLDYTIDFGRSGRSLSGVGRRITNYTYTETGLNRGTSYFFQIMPVVDSTFGLMMQTSEQIHVRTFSAIPVMLVSAEPTSLLLQWTLPVLEINQMIRARSQTVSIFYDGPCELDEVAQPSQVMVVGEEVRMIRLENLEELSDYSVVIAAEYPNEILSGSVSVTTQPAVPAFPPASVTIERTTNTTITVSWEPVPCLDRNSRIAGYIVEYGPTTSYPETQSPVLQDLTFTIQDRQPNTSYSFQVYPVLEFGQGLEELPVPSIGLVTVKTQPNLPMLSVPVAENQGSSVETGLTAGVVVLVILLAAVAVVGIVLLVRTIAAKKDKMHKERPDAMELEDCVAYIPSNLVSPTDVQPSDFTHDQLPISPQSPMLPMSVLAPPALSRHEISCSNPYETIPYTMHKDVLSDSHAYNRLSRYQVPGKQEERRGISRENVIKEEAPVRSGGMADSYDDAI